MLDKSYIARTDPHRVVTRTRGEELYSLRSRTRICRLHKLVRRWFWPTVAAFALSLPGTTLAIPDATGDSPNRAGPASPVSERERATVHFNAAMEHYRGRRYREAIREFELALALLPSADVHWNLARTHERLGEYARAADHYRLYLRDRVDAPDARDVSAKIEWLLEQAASADSDEDRPELGMLALDTGDPRRLVLLDGRQLESPSADRVLDVTPGRHRLEVSQSGFVPFVAEMTIDAGTLGAAHVEMAPLSRPPARASSGDWAWTLASVSAALLVGSGAFGLVALSERDDGNLDTARRWAIASDLTLGGALCSALGATLLFLSRDHTNGTGQEPVAHGVRRSPP